MIHSGFVHLNGNLMVAIDYETTGLQAGYHEIIQVGVVPLDADLQPISNLRPFYHNIAPKFPERQEKGTGEIHGLDLNELMLHEPSSERVTDLFVDWWERLELPMDRKINPLAHNYEFEASFGKAWLGFDLYNQMFYWQARDGMRYAISQNDKAAFAGEPVPYPRVGLNALAKQFQIVNENPHDALSDAYAEARVYRALLHHGLF